MNILYLSHRIPFPPNKGDKIRSFHQVQYLSQGHSIFLACLIDDPEDLQHVDTLRRICRNVEVAERTKLGDCWRMGLAVLRSQALSVGVFLLPELQKKIDHIIAHEQIDRIVIFSSAMAEYVKHVKGIPVIMDFVDMDSEKWLAYSKVKPFPFSFLYDLESRRLAKYETALAQRCDYSITISSEEAGVLERQSDGKVIPRVIPNGVDYEYFSPLTESNATEPIIVFTAAMDYFPNVDGAKFFCQEIFPLIHREVPQARFEIVGRCPTPSLRRVVSSLENVTLTGTVPDVRPYLNHAVVAVAPLRIARGVQNKILEAMAMGCPVVGTSQAFLGLKPSKADGMLKVDGAREFAETVITLLRDPARAKEYGKCARKYVMTHFDWSQVLQDLESIVCEVKG